MLSKFRLLLAVPVLAAGMLAAPAANADWYRGGHRGGWGGHGHYRGGWGGPRYYHRGYGGYGYGRGYGPGAIVGGALLGLGAGAVIAGAIAPRVYYPPTYYAPPAYYPPVYAPPPPYYPPYYPRY